MKVEFGGGIGAIPQQSRESYCREFNRTPCVGMTRIPPSRNTVYPHVVRYILPTSSSHLRCTARINSWPTTIHRYFQRHFPPAHIQHQRSNWACHLFHEGLVSIKDMDTAAADLRIISDWIEEEGFKLNVEKVKAMMTSRKKDPPQVSLQLLGQPIETVSSFRLLGITVTNNLLWNQHILEASKKAKKILGFVYRVFGSSGQHCLARLYKSIVLPHLDYCSSLWDPQYKVHIKRLESVQTFAARIATKSWSDDGKGIKARLGWPELAVRRLQQKMSLCRRIVTGNSIIPPSFFMPHPRPSHSHKNSAPLFRPPTSTNTLSSWHLE